MISASMELVRLMKELRLKREEEERYIPKEAGLRLIETPAAEGDCRITATCRDAKVMDMWSLASFFGYSTETFALAVNLLDRFLALIRVQPKHLSCVSLSCLHMAAKATEEESNLTPREDLIRIGQCRFTASDLSRMEKIVAEKLDFKSKTITALTFLHLYHKMALSHFTDRKPNLNLDNLESQLKACLCQISFSRAKPSILALSLIRQQLMAMESKDLMEMSYDIQRLLRMEECELRLWTERVGERLSAYASPKCNVPNHRKLLWIVSRRTALNLQKHRSVPELASIPEVSWDESESEESSEDLLSSGEDSLSSSLGSDAEGQFFPKFYYARSLSNQQA